MAEVVDIIHNLSYQVQGEESLQRILGNLKAQASNVEVLTKALEKQKRLLADTPKSDVARREALQRVIANTTATIERQTAAIQKEISSNKALQAAFKDEISVIGSLQKKLKDLQTARDNVAKSGNAIKDRSVIAGYNKQIRQVENELGSLTNSYGDKFGGIGKSLLMGLGIGGGIQLAQQGIQYVKQWVSEASELAAQAEGVSAAFNRLNDPNLLSNLRAATRGTVSDLELMKNAVQFNNFGLPVERLGTALEFARTRARETGVSVDYLVQSIVTGVGRQSPLILDNLGINAKRVSDEFKRTGNFAEAAFNIIQEEGTKSGKVLQTYADVIDRANASIANTQVKAGTWWNDIKAEFIASLADLVDGQLSGTPGVNQQAVIDAVEQRKKIEAEQDALVRHSEQIMKQLEIVSKTYSGSDAKTREQIYQQALKMQANMLASAKAFYKEDQEAYQRYANGILGVFNKLWEKLGIVPATIDPLSKALADMNISELEAAAKSNADAINTLSANALKDPAKLKERDRLLKENDEIEKLRKQITGERDKSAIKSANNIADQRLDLERKLQEQIAALQDAGEDRRIEKMRDGIPKILAANAAALRRAQRKIDDEQAQAQRKGILTDRAAQQFDEIRLMLNAQTEQRILEQRLDYLRKYYDQAKAIEKANLDARISQGKLFNELYPTEQGFREVAQLETQSALIENEQKYSKLIEQAANHGGDLISTTGKINVEILKLYRDQKQNEQLIQEQGNRNDLQALAETLDTRLKMLQDYGNYTLALISSDAIEEENALSEKYRRGEISYRRYLKELKRIKQQEDQGANSSRYNSLGSQIDEAQSSYEKIASDPNARDVDVQAAFTRLNALKIEQRKVREEGEKIDEDIKKARVERVMQWVDVYQQATNAIVGALNQVTQAQQAALDREINIREQRVEQAKKLAERGNADALRIEEERLRESQKKREEYARREQIINSALALSNAIVAVAQTAAESGVASIATIPAVIAALAAGYAFVRSMDTSAGFKKGGYTGDGNTSEVAGPVHKREFVFDAESTKRIGIDNLERMRKGTFAMPVFNTEKMQDNTLVTRKEFNSLGQKLDAVVEAVNNNKVKVSQRMDKDGLAQAVETYQKNDRRRFAS